MEPRLRAMNTLIKYVGRDTSASPATGSRKVHLREQKELVEAAIAGTVPHLVRAVAAYNGGPATIAKTAQMLGDNADSLLLMECLPAQETRMYVQRVLAGYWTYRRMWGQTSPSLDALAAGDKAIDERLDLRQPNGPAPQLAAKPLQVGMR